MADSRIESPEKGKGPSSRFLPDEPIKSFVDDCLGRSEFAKHLGEALLSYDNWPKRIRKS